jgi:hypothetical protein
LLLKVPEFPKESGAGRSGLSGVGTVGSLFS